MATTQKYSATVRHVPSDVWLEELDARLQEYEVRYEMSSEKMAALLEMDAIRPTAEVIKWYAAYQGKVYARRGTLTTGTPGTTTAPSTKPG